MAVVSSAVRGWVKQGIRIDGKTALITGSNAGVGHETAKDLARRGARVLLACRNLQKARQAKEKIIQETGSPNVVVRKLDLSSFASIRKFADDVVRTEKRLDILINNAGIMLCGPKHLTEDGYEMHIGVNYLGHFLLTNLLLRSLVESSPSRIVTVSSSSHKLMTIFPSMNWDLKGSRNFLSTEAYMRSKLMNILFSRELSKRLEGTGVTSNCVHPGLVDTTLFRSVQSASNYSEYTLLMTSKMKMFMKGPEHGAQTIIYCAIAPELHGLSGKYYSNCKIAKESARARDDAIAKKLWIMSEEYTGLNDELGEMNKREISRCAKRTKKAGDN